MKIGLKRKKAPTETAEPFQTMKANENLYIII